MAINKRKILENARKYAQKGAKEKALKEYNTLLKHDPRDAKLHLEIGDAHRRWGQIEEAIAEYSRVAEQYKQEGFDARSVAVFKQILNLDSKRYLAHVSLSELYHRMGLDAEAIHSLQTAADGYHKEGKKREALELLRKMAGIDPTNTTSRLKVADLLHQEGMDEDAIAEYEEVAGELQRTGATEELIGVYDRILEVEPNRVDVLVSVARAWIEMRQPERAEAYARRAHEAQPDEPDFYELLCDVYQVLGKSEALAETTRALAKLYRERGDETRAREIMQRLPSEDLFQSAVTPSESSAESAPVDDEDELLSDDELLGDDDFLDSDGIDGDLEPVQEELRESVAPESEASATPKASPTPVALDDPEQMLAEASVYLRYGKRDQALASLETLVAAMPGHVGALEKLGEVYADGGDSDRAVELWVRAAESACADGDVATFEDLKARIATLDPAAADVLTSAQAEAPSVAHEPALHAEPDLEDLSDIEIDVDLDLDGDSEDVAQADLDEPEHDAHSLELEIDVGGSEIDTDTEFDADSDYEVSDVGIEIDAIDGEGEDTGVQGETSHSEVAVAYDASELEIDHAEEVDSYDDREISGSHGDSMDTGGVAASQTSAGQSSTTTQQIAEDLEEAEFYFQQQLFDEAEAIYRRILSMAPNHPSALLRMGELAVSKGEDPGVSATDLDLDSSDATADYEAEEDVGSEASLDPRESSLDPGESSHDPGEPALDPGEPVHDPGEPVHDPGESVHDPGESAFDIEIGIGDDDDFDELCHDDVGELDETTAGSDADDSEDDTLSGVSIDPAATTEPVSATPISFEAQPCEEPVSARVSAVPAIEDDDGQGGREVEPHAPFAAVNETPDDSFDLAAELRGVLDDDGDAPDELASSHVLSNVDDGFESVFADFKRGVSNALTDADLETRYDLGIAYREMGLLQDAIGEFRVCLEWPARRIEALQLMGLCAIDLGRFEDGISHLEQALSMPDLPEERRTGILFDLGRARVQVGDLARARSDLEQVQAAEPEFPGLEEQLAAIATDRAAAADTESLDDVSSHGGEEVFESFDDVITEIEQADADRRNEETVPSVDVETDASVNADSSSRPRPPRKKKISFV